MKKFWLYFLLGFILLLLSLETATAIDIKTQVPDLLLFFIIFLGQRKGPFIGLLVGFFIGLFIDFFSGQLVGAMAFSKMTIGLLSGLVGTRLIVYNFQTDILLNFIFSCIQALVFYFILTLFSNISTSNYFGSIWISIVYTLLVSPIVIFLMNLIDRNNERF